MLDCAKAIVVGARFDGDIWDVITGKSAGDGCAAPWYRAHLGGHGLRDECEFRHHELGDEGKGRVGGGSYTYPAFSILDPVYTFTVPREHTVYGIVDMMCHALEQYFHTAENTPLQDRWIEALLRTVIEAAPKALENPEDYEARETLLYCGTMALNHILSMGTGGGDWATHDIEHAVSAVYDIPHGGGLAIPLPQLDEIRVGRGSGPFCPPRAGSVRRRPRRPFRKGSRFGGESSGCAGSGRIWGLPHAWRTTASATKTSRSWRRRRWPSVRSASCANCPRTTSSRSTACRCSCRSEVRA